MLEPRIQQHFFESADLLYQVAEHLSGALSDGAQAAVGCLTSGGKLLIGGTGAGQWLAELMCVALLRRLERDRPPLAAVSLNCGMTQPYPQTASGSATGHDGLSSQVMALGQAGDLLVLFCLDIDESANREAIAEAHGKEMSVLLISAASSRNSLAPLAETDVWIAIPHDRALRVMELQLLALHALCDAIDLQLLGEADSA